MLDSVGYEPKAHRGNEPWAYARDFDQDGFDGGGDYGRTPKIPTQLINVLLGYT